MNGVAVDHNVTGVGHYRQTRFEVSKEITSSEPLAKAATAAELQWLTQPCFEYPAGAEYRARGVHADLVCRSHPYYWCGSEYTT